MLGLCERLAHEPRSLWRAKQLGGPHFFGWSGDSMRLADIIDMLYLNTQVSAVNKGKPKEVAVRPKADERPQEIEAKKATRVADLDWGSAMQQFQG